MDLGLQGKTALVLASSKGIGKEIAKKLSLEGANLMIASRDEERLKQTAEELKQLSSGAVHYQVCDVTDASSIEQLAQNTVATYGTIDVLINNAGGPPAGSFEIFKDEDWQRAFELNLLSVVRAVRAVLPYMKNNGGRILNIVSTSIKEPIDGLILSNTFRTAVIGLAKSLSSELGKYQILINSIGPGRILTDRINELEQTEASALGISQEALQENVKKTIPLGRYGSPEELANIAVFLASFANTYVTGQAILVDGGKTKAI